MIAGIEEIRHGPSAAMHNPSQPFGFLSKETCGSLLQPPITKTKSAQIESYALSWKPCQGDSLNLPDHSGITLALEGKNKTGFIDGSCRRSNTDEVLGRQWDRVNVVKTYDKVDGSVTFNLHHKINSLSQNGSSIADYYRRLNALWKQFDALFLMGLDDCYMQIRSNILSRDELPNVRSAYAIISSEESHRVVSSFSVGTSQRFQSSVFSSKETNEGSPLVCKNYGFNGHTIDMCFKLIGYPPDCGKRNNSSNTNQNNQNFNRRFISNNNSTGSSSTFSDEQISKLLSLIKESSLGDKGKGVQANMAVSHPNGTEALITKDLMDVKIMEIGRQVNSLYYFDNVEGNMLKFGNFSNNSKINWHNRLGHPSDQAKQTREPFPLSEHKSTVLGELVHLDLWGPYRVVSKEGHRYFLTIVDEFTRAVLPSSVLKDKIVHEGPDTSYDDNSLNAHDHSDGSYSSQPSSPTIDHYESDLGHSQGSNGSASESTEFLNGLRFPDKYNEYVCDSKIAYLGNLCDLPKDRKSIGGKWVFKIKYKSNGEIKRYKARYVVKGYNQKEGIDFDETFSPVVKIVTNNVEEIEKFKEFLRTKFQIKDLGKLKYFLGIEVLETNLGVCLSQRKYCLDLLRILRYLKSNLGKGIHIVRQPKATLEAFVDAYWAKCLATRKSVTGFCVKLNDSLISWKSKKQHTLAKSSAEAEYRAMASVTFEVT
ncbi:ribonuclease H-like domain-containing protein [Tanacetum coccineum]